MSNLNLIIGTDQKLIDFYFQGILNKLDYNKDNKITYDISTNSFSLILDEASMISLFSPVKIIIGTNFDISKLNDNDIDYLSKYLKNINKDVYIILISEKIDARVKAYKLFKDNFNIVDTTKENNKSDITSYIKNIVNDKKYKMSDNVIEYFISRIGNDINNINSELDKLFTYKEEDKTIDINDIELLTTDNIDNVIYEFTNAILDNDIDKTTTMYNNFKIENVSFDYLISSISNSIHQCLIIKILHNDGESNLSISKIIGKKEFYVIKMLERLYNYTEADLAKMISKLAKIDKDFKSGKSNIDALELFLLDKDR